MDPQGFMRFQMFMLVLAYGLLAFLTDPLPLCVMVGLLLAVALLFGVSYLVSLKKRRRHPKRVTCDTEVFIQIAIGVVAPFACLGVRSLFDLGPVTDSTNVMVALIAAAAFWWAVYVSSLIDWFYIRARRDGVVCEPPCRTSGAKQWRTVTRVWWANRCLVIAACYLTFIVFVVGLGLALYADVFGGSTDSTAVAVALVPGIGGATAFVKLFYGGLSAVGEVHLLFLQSARAPDRPGSGRPIPFRGRIPEGCRDRGTHRCAAR